MAGQGSARSTRFHIATAKQMEVVEMHTLEPKVVPLQRGRRLSDSGAANTRAPDHRLVATSATSAQCLVAQTFYAF